MSVTALRAVEPPVTLRQRPLPLARVPFWAVQVWAAVLLQVAMSPVVLRVVDPPVSLRHRPELLFTIACPPVGGGVVPPARLAPRVLSAFWTIAWALAFKVELVPFTTQDGPEKIA